MAQSSKKATTPAKATKPPPPIAPSTTLMLGALGSMLLGAIHIATWTYGATIEVGSIVLMIFGLLGGALLIGLGLLARRRSRAAWSFLLAFNGVAALVSVFGGPAIHRAFDIPLSAAFVPFALHGATAVLLALSAGELERAK
jgi:hypothetical protein